MIDNVIKGLCAAYVIKEPDETRLALETSALLISYAHGYVRIMYYKSFKSENYYYYCIQIAFVIFLLVAGECLFCTTSIKFYNLHNVLP